MVGGQPDGELFERHLRGLRAQDIDSHDGFDFTNAHLYIPPSQVQLLDFMLPIVLSNKEVSSTYSPPSGLWHWSRLSKKPLGFSFSASHLERFLGVLRAMISGPVESFPNFSKNLLLKPIQADNLVEFFKILQPHRGPLPANSGQSRSRTLLGSSIRSHQLWIQTGQKHS